MKKFGLLMFLILAVSTITLIGFTETVHAECHLRPAIRNVNYNHGYGYQNYQYNYNQTYYPYHNQNYYIPKVIEVEVHRDHYYSIDPYLQQNLLADAIVGRLIRLQGQVPVKNNPVQQNPPVQPNPAPVQPKVNSSGVDLKSLPDVPGPYQNEKLLAVFAKSCNKCHNYGSNYPLITTENKILDVPKGVAWEAFGLVNTGEMPKSSPNLDDESVKLFYEWAKNIKK